MNRMNNKLYHNFTECRVFHKTQHPFMIKLIKLGTEGMDYKPVL